ncbi:hypothetical protein [Hymenobacter coccineus]|uniref:Beta-xylosidase C-terminal Concanavalin A-like domain-containing protein n=1 Tax=Hymenobacter coccineus TaxID=1908235 RepID=A0A1G1TF49_9BACT|nr:hypothetical protein BEN49_24855 [Hymenobacter coccineus]
MRRTKGQEDVLVETALPANSPPLRLRLQARQNTHFAFAYSTDNGRTWAPMAGADGPTVDGAYLPPWDRGIRVGVLAQGPAAVVDFDEFTLTSQP